jgi:small subunit ribosomal protein S2e
MAEPAPAAVAAPAQAAAPQEGARAGGERRFGGKGPRRGPPRARGDREQWNPVTKLGRLVKYGKITTLEEIFRYAIPIKEPQIIDHIMKNSEKKLDEEVMKVCPVQKQTQAGQRTRFKAWVLIGDHEGHLGLGIKAAKEVQTAIKGAILSAKLNIAPVRRGYWGNKIGNPHTIPGKVQGKSGSVRVRLIPAPV